MPSSPRFVFSSFAEYILQHSPMIFSGLHCALALIGIDAARIQASQSEIQTMNINSVDSVAETVGAKKQFTKYYDFATATTLYETQKSVRGLSAVKLELTKKSAYMTAYPDHHWRAELETPFKKDDSNLVWLPVLDEDALPNQPVKPAVVINLFEDGSEVLYFARKVVADAPAQLEIHYTDGSMDTLQGGVYYDEKTVKSAILMNSYTKYNTGVGGSPEAGKFEEAKGDDFEKIAQTALKTCQGKKKCMGFQYNPAQKVCEETCSRNKCKSACSSTLIHYLETPANPSREGMFGPTKCPSEKRTCRGFVPTPLTQWTSTMYTPVNSEGLELKPKRAFGKPRTHMMSRETVGDSMTGNGKLAQSSEDLESVMYKAKLVDGYRKTKMIASERLWNDLQSLSWKKCETVSPKTHEIMTPADKPCPHFGQVE